VGGFYLVNSINAPSESVLSNKARISP
jgi:hypothetical protein